MIYGLRKKVRTCILIRKHRRKGCLKTMAEPGVTDLQAIGQHGCSETPAAPEGEGREIPLHMPMEGRSQGGDGGCVDELTLIPPPGSDGYLALSHKHS